MHCPALSGSSLTRALEGRREVRKGFCFSFAVFGKGAQRLLVMSWRKALSVSCCVTGLLKLNCLKQQEVNISVSVSEGLRGTFYVVPALGRLLLSLSQHCIPLVSHGRSQMVSLWCGLFSGLLMGLSFLLLPNNE